MKYRTIVADPPWPMRNDGGPRTRASSGHFPVGTRPRYTYPTLTVEEIAAMSIPAAVDAHLYLWTINATVEDAFDVARAWNFRPAQLLVWAKTPRGLGLGGTFTNSTEFILFCRRGKLKAKQRVHTTWWNWPRPEIGTGPLHSRKPDAFLDLVEQVSPGPYLELFARRQRLGWDTYGDEALEHVSMETA